MVLTDKDLNDILIALDFAEKNYAYESHRFGELKRKIKRVREPFSNKKKEIIIIK